MRTIEGINYASKEAYTAFADEKKLSREDLQSVYETIAGAPKVKRLRNRGYAIDRIWDVSPVAQEKPASEPKAKREPKPRTAKSDKPAAGDSKKATVLRMLAGDGTTLDRLMKETGWQAHTCRGALSTLRSKGGYNIVASRADKITIYRIATA